MEEIPSLQIYADLFVAFAGFSAVVAALGRGNIEQWSDVDRNRMRGLILVSLMGVLLSVLPVNLHAFGLSAAFVWRIICAICLAGVGAVYLRMLFWMQRAHAFEAEGFSRFFFYSLSALALPVLMMEALAAAGFWPGKAAAIFLSGLTVILALCSGMFVLLLRAVLWADGTKPR